jgi:hypothetical protein
VDAHLRSVADEWFARFGFKTSARKMLAMLGESGDGIFTEDEMRGICFAFLLQKLAGQDLRDVEEIARQPLFRMLFPNGLYRHYTAAGYPTVSFKFSRPSDFTAAFREELYSGQRDGDFARVLRLAKLFFGTEDLPEELAAIAGPFLRERIARFGAEVEHAFNEVFKNREYADGWKDLARQLLANYDAMQKLDPT